MSAAEIIRDVAYALADAERALRTARQDIRAAYEAADAAYRAAPDPDEPGISDAEAEARYRVWSETEAAACDAEQCRDDLAEALRWLDHAPVNLRLLADLAERVVRECAA